MIKSKFEISRWARWGDSSGGFHLGAFIDWEPWLVTIGLDLGFWEIHLEFRIPLSEEMAERLRQKPGSVTVGGTVERKKDEA